MLGSRKFKVTTNGGDTEYVTADKYGHDRHGHARFWVFKPGTMANVEGFRPSELVTSYQGARQVVEVDIPEARAHVGRHPWNKPAKPKETVVAKLTIDGGMYADAKKTDMIRLLNDFCKRQSYGLDIISIEVEVVK